MWYFFSFLKGFRTPGTTLPNLPTSDTQSPAGFGKHFHPRMIPGDTSVVSARQVDDSSRGHVIDHKDMECERETETGKETKRGRLQWSVRGTEAQQGSILINDRHFSKETLDCIVQDLFIDVTSERSVWVFVRAEVAFSVLLGTEQDEYAQIRTNKLKVHKVMSCPAKRRIPHISVWQSRYSEISASMCYFIEPKLLCIRLIKESQIFSSPSLLLFAIRHFKMCFALFCVCK